MFQQAAKMNLTFPTPSGDLSVAQVYTLPLVASAGKLDLNTVARQCAQEAKGLEDEDFVGVASNDPKRQRALLRFDLIKAIIADKKADNDRKTTEKLTADKRQMVLNLLQEKQNQKLADYSEEQLKELLATLT